MGRLSPVFSLITTRAEWYGLPHSGHFEVTLFPLFKQCICLSKGTSFIWVFKRTKRYQDLRNLNCITSFNYYFMACPTSPYASLPLAVMTRQGDGKETSKPLSSFPKLNMLGRFPSPSNLPSVPPRKERAREGHWKAEHQEKKKIRVKEGWLEGRNPTPLSQWESFPWTLWRN